MKSFLSNLIQNIDKIYVNPHLYLFGDLNGVLCLCFHTVFQNKKEKENIHTLPWLGLTIDEYRYIFEYFLEYNYKFISFKEIQGKLESNCKYIHITFDDGYFNNTRIIPILEEYSIPGHFFVVTNNIINSNKFWWDIVYSNRISSGRPLDEVNYEISFLQKYHYKKINTYIYENFGTSAFKPLSDLDRPLTTNELKELYKNKLITIGNHTSDHAMLNNLTTDESREQVKKAQEALKTILGEEAKSFAYPNSSYNKNHFKILSSLGLDFAFAGDYRRNRVPSGLEDNKKFHLGRFDILDNRDINWQIKMLRAGITPFTIAKELHRTFFY